MILAAQDIIKGAMRALGVLDKSEAPTSDEMNDALQALNMMIDEWSARRLMSTALTRLSFPLAGNQQSYTIGPGGNFNTTVPFDITSAFLRDGYGLDYPLEIMTREVFDSMQDKSFVSAPPQRPRPSPEVSAHPAETCEQRVNPKTTVSESLRSPKSSGARLLSSSRYR